MESKIGEANSQISGITFILFGDFRIMAISFKLILSGQNNCLGRKFDR